MCTLEEVDEAPPQAEHPAQDVKVLAVELDEGFFGDKTRFD